MKQIQVSLLIAGVIMTTVATAAQVTSASSVAPTQSQLRNRTSANPLPLRTQESRLATTASASVITVKCPAEAQALGAVCGRVSVPLHRDHPNKETIKI